MTRWTLKPFEQANDGWLDLHNYLYLDVFNDRADIGAIAFFNETPW